jgi:heat-inducible transcriptional repressor
MDERKAAILNTVVTEYIETAQPVGSVHVVRDPSIDVSAATVRADMAALEREGYLTHPHTSAGRIPTDKGYRFFVDHLAGSHELGEGEVRQVQSFFDAAHGEIERMLRDTSTLLSELTNYAAVVVAPDHETLTVCSAMLARLGPRTGLMVVVHSDGSVEKHPVELPEGATETTVAAASARLQAGLVGRPLAAGAADPPAPSGDRDVDDVLKRCHAALAAQAGKPDVEQVYVGGASRMARAFDAVETVRAVLTTLEKTYVVVNLLQDALAHERFVSIGGEHGIGPLAECSVVVAPYEIDREVVGTIGVLGPTRMNYPQALAAVAVVGRRLGRELSAASG